MTSVCLLLASRRCNTSVTASSREKSALACSVAVLSVAIPSRCCSSLARSIIFCSMLCFRSAFDRRGHVPSAVFVVSVTSQGLHNWRIWSFFGFWSFCASTCSVRYASSSPVCAPNIEIMSSNEFINGGDVCCGVTDALILGSGDTCSVATLPWWSFDSVVGVVTATSVCSVP